LGRREQKIRGLAYGVAMFQMMELGDHSGANRNPVRQGAAGCGNDAARISAAKPMPRASIAFKGRPFLGEPAAMRKRSAAEEGLWTGSTLPSSLPESLRGRGQASR